MAGSFGWVAWPTNEAVTGITIVCMVRLSDGTINGPRAQTRCARVHGGLPASGHQPDEVNGRGEGEQQAVQPIEDAAVAGDQVAAIFDVGRAFE